MKKLLLSLCLSLFCTVAQADEITFSFIELGNGVVDVTCGADGCTFGPALNIVVSDTAKGLQFPIAGTFNASTGVASTVTSEAGRYLATFAEGGHVAINAGSTILVSGSPVLADSHLSAVDGNEGSFHGEFNVTDVSGSVLAMFGLPDKWKPTGSVSVTFGDAHVSGDTLTGVIGGGTVTIETPQVSLIPEPDTYFLFGSGILTMYAFYRRFAKGV